jgi:hypothetical protein
LRPRTLRPQLKRDPLDSATTMNRILNPVILGIRDVVETELERLGFRLSSEQFHYEAFGSAQFEYHRRGTRLRLVWDGKDQWAWISLAPQPTDAFPHPSTYRDIDAPFVKPNSMARFLTTTEQGRARADELIRHLETALSKTGQGARAV